MKEQGRSGQISPLPSDAGVDAADRDAAIVQGLCLQCYGLDPVKWSSDGVRWLWVCRQRSDPAVVRRVQWRAGLGSMDPAMERRSDGGRAQIRQGGMWSGAGEVAQGLRSSSRCTGLDPAAMACLDPVVVRPDPAVAWASVGIRFDFGWDEDRRSRSGGPTVAAPGCGRSEVGRLASMETGGRWSCSGFRWEGGRSRRTLEGRERRFGAFFFLMLAHCSS
ncbi:hypothetical protein COCNU_scaffold005002G000010 [Cocos nucifera]|nr:hypothetical protein [Cocos nucifera]